MGWQLRESIPASQRCRICDGYGSFMAAAPDRDPSYPCSACNGSGKWPSLDEIEPVIGSTYTWKYADSSRKDPFCSGEVYTIEDTDWGSSTAVVRCQENGLMAQLTWSYINMAMAPIKRATDRFEDLDLD